MRAAPTLKDLVIHTAIATMYGEFHTDESEDSSMSVTPRQRLVSLLFDKQAGNMAALGKALAGTLGSAKSTTVKGLRSMAGLKRNEPWRPVASTAKMLAYPDIPILSKRAPRIAKALRTAGLGTTATSLGVAGVEGYNNLRGMPAQLADRRGPA